jgi:predicted ATPase
LPFIDDLKLHCKLYYLEGKDFRIRHDIINEKYIFPINEENQKKFYDIFKTLTYGNEGYI